MPQPIRRWQSGRGRSGSRPHEQEAPAPVPPMGRQEAPGPGPRVKQRSPDPGEADADPVDIAETAGDPEVKRLAQFEIHAEADREDRIAVVAKRQSDDRLQIGNEADPALELD